MNKANDPALIDDESHSSRSVMLLYLPVFIGNHGELHAILSFKFVMSRQTVCAYTQNLGVELFKTMEVILKSFHFTCSRRGKISKVEGEDNVLFTEKISQPGNPLG